MGDRLRILHFVCGEYERGGMQKHVLDLTAAQAASGDALAIAAHETFREHVAAGVEFLPLDTTRHRRDAGLRDDLRRSLAAWRPNVLHAHAGKSAEVVGSLMPLPCASVATVHGLKRNLRAPARFDRVIAVSEFAAARLPRDRTTVVLNGADPAPRDPVAPTTLAEFFGDDDAAPVAIAIGRLAPVKGFDTAIRAWPRVRVARLLIVGDGPERAKLERLVDRHGVRGRVAFAGVRLDGAALIGRSSLLVAPSRREGFPYVVVEALHARVPIVTTRTSGAAPFLPGDFLVPPRSPGRLAEAVNRALEEDASTRAAFAPVFDRAARKLTLAGMSRATRSVYGEAIRAFRTRHPPDQV